MELFSSKKKTKKQEQDFAYTGRSNAWELISFVVGALSQRGLNPFKLAYDRYLPDESLKDKFHYALWSQTGPKLVADLLARASSLLAS